MEAAAANSNFKVQRQEDGRACSGSCGRWLAWDHFNLKSNGLNGRDSRCKNCISRAKKVYKGKERRHLKEVAKLKSEIIGHASLEKIESFARIISNSIMNLIEEGAIK